MSRFAHHLRFAAIGALGAASLAGPARADAVPASTAEACSHLSARTVAACRAPLRSARRSVPRTVVADPVRPFLADLGDFPTGRYVSLLILGVGF